MISRLTFYALAAIAAASFVAAGVIVISRNATERTVIKIERQNNAAGDEADGARGQFDGCSGGVWDFGSGQCRRAAPSGRD
ncbi:hypothetical protein [uncultured Agrobacterium sp.]|uniref:hypothetical protein n=1 Tax=uncultured Agrobacterium sp. TaxID=157277 RepID=UPI0025E5F9C6|nr:hypothetical protein [uncultured Agrobacterium sp.]